MDISSSEIWVLNMVDVATCDYGYVKLAALKLCFLDIGTCTQES